MRRSFAAAAIYAASAGMNRRTMHRVPTSSMLIVDHTHTLRAPQSRAQGASDVSFRGSYPSDFGDSFWPILRVGEDIAALTPHRPERAQFAHSVLHSTGSHTVKRSGERSEAQVTGR